jgi:hypothetical protein
MDEKPLPKYKHCQKQHVVVRFPGHAGKIQVLRPELPNIKSLPGKKGIFEPYRLVINLKLQHADQPNVQMLKLDPPVEVRVRYDTTDLNNTKGSLRIAFWDGKQWVPFTKASHNFHLEGWDEGKGRGWAVASLTEWADPPIAVGT